MSGYSFPPGNPCGLFGKGMMDGREVHVWECCLTAGEGGSSRLQDTLSKDEKRRACRFHFERDRRCYTVAHGMLKEILASYLDKDPRCLQFSPGSFGKPYLAASLNDPDIRFSLSRSQDLALVAIADGMEIGVDLECIEPNPVVSEIARRYFSAKENASLSTLFGSAYIETFFRCWTRKEAFLKGKGIGLLQDPAGFEVSLLPGEPAALLDCSASPAEVKSWELFDLPVIPGYSASLAVQGHGSRIVYRKWVGGRKTMGYPKTTQTVLEDLSCRTE